MDRLKDECPICTENNLAESKGELFESIRMLCCGTLICKSCDDKIQQSALATGIPYSCPICRTLPPKSAKEAFDRTMNHAKIGRLWAQEKVAQFYMKGYGVTQSDPKAFEFYSLAAAKGDSSAQNWIACFYREGRGVAQSYEKSFIFYQKAAEQGLASAQCNLAHCYFMGWGVVKSLEKAFQWYLRSTENGCMESCSQIGLFYHKGYGVEKDHEKAVHYFIPAAEKNHKLAQYILASCFFHGEGVKKSFPKAIYWIRRCLKDNIDEGICASGKELLETCLFISSEECSSCGHKAKLHLKCSKCLSAYYCNRNCQKNHWKNGHKQECIET